MAYVESEDGWRPPDLNASDCDWIEIPGCNPRVTILVMRHPLVMPIIRAYVADYNAYIEPVRDRDTACFTPENTVFTSNHKNATAVDINWDDHAFRVSYAGFDAAKIQRMREMLAFYMFEGIRIMFWAQDWANPKDCMHHQMGYNTFQNQDVLARFVKERIRPDGFSTYKRDGVPIQPPAPPTLSRAEGYALRIIAVGESLGITPRGVKIALAVGLVETGLTNYANSNDPASLQLPHDAVGSDHMSAGWAQQQPPWGPLADRMNIEGAARIFFTVDHGPGVRGLTKIRDSSGNLLDYNDVTHSPGWYAQKVQGSAFPDRYDQRYTEAERLYTKLKNLGQPESSFLMALTDQEQRDLYNAVCGWRISKSPMRPVGQGEIGSLRDYVAWIDGSVHWGAVKAAAELGYPPALKTLREIAAADVTRYPDRADDALLAQAILAGIEKQRRTQGTVVVAPQNGAAVVDHSAELQRAYAEIDRLRSELEQARAAQQVSTALVPVTNGVEPSMGQLIGQTYDVLERLRLADSLPVEARAPLAALISVLSTKNGSNL